MNATTQTNRPSERTRTLSARAQALRADQITALVVYEPGDATPARDIQRLPNTQERGVEVA